jgi:hypothetical protein
LPPCYIREYYRRQGTRMNRVEKNLSDLGQSRLYDLVDGLGVRWEAKADHLWHVTGNIATGWNPSMKDRGRRDDARRRSQRVRGHRLGQRFSRPPPSTTRPPLRVGESRRSKELRQIVILRLAELRGLSRGRDICGDRRCFVRVVRDQRRFLSPVQ